MRNIPNPPEEEAKRHYPIDREIEWCDGWKCGYEAAQVERTVMRITQRKVFDLGEVNEADIERIVDWFNAAASKGVSMDARDDEIARTLREALRG